MKRGTLLLAALALCGCSGADRELEARLARQEETIRSLEGRIQELEKHDAAQYGEPKPSDIQRYARQVGLAQKDIQRDLRSQQEQIDDLREALKKAEPAGAAQASGTAAEPNAATRVASRASSRDTGFHTPVTVYEQPDPAREDFIVPPTDPKADLFPVAISEVRSEKIVTGKHQTTQIVLTDKTYEDDFGNMVRARSEQDVELLEHDYTVRFVAQNLTKTPKDITVGAGRDSEVFTLQPGETQTNLTVAAAFGAGLTVRARGEVRRYAVEYSD